MLTNGVISPLTWVLITVTLLITPLITTLEPPSIVGAGQKELQPQPGRLGERLSKRHGDSLP